MKPLMRLATLFVLLNFLTGCVQAAAQSAVSTETPAPPPTEPAETTSTDAYTVNITPVDFVDVVDNPYFPLIPGTKWVYEATLGDGSTERIELEILHETREVNGVTATILHDMVFVDGELVEDTYDWHAQDKDGNVWYLGEDVDNYEDGVLVDHEGAWEWGVDGALPGIIMWADPAAHLNEEYYQEYYVGEAEDMGQVLDVGKSVTVPAGSFDNVVQTYDFSSLDPDIQAHKFYAPGIGIIKEVELNGEEEVVLIEFNAPDDDDEAGDVEDNDDHETGEGEESNVAPDKIGITGDEAKAAAEAAYPGAKAVAVEVEKENGKAIYEVELDNGLEVIVDAGNGEVLGTEQEN